MSNDTQAPVVVPDLTTAIELKLRDAFSTLYCHHVGTIKSFNTSKQTATVALNTKLEVAGITKEFPLLTDVPVFVLGGGNRVITIPIQDGDTCLVCFADRDIDNWFSTGGTSLPSSKRLHDLSDGFALVGFRSMANPVSQYSGQDVEIRNGENKIAVGDKLLLKNAATNLLTVMQAVVTALNTLNGVKTGGDASAAITLANTQIQSLLKSS